MNILLSDKIMAFCWDNCNTHFGGAARIGSNNVFVKGLAA
jgi:hypothetical protein